VDQRCLLIEELEQLSRLRDDDPRRRHVEDCPRCAARLSSLRLFLDPLDPAAGADPEAAEAHLRAALRRSVRPRRAGRILPPAWVLAAAAAALLLLWIGLPRPGFDSRPSERLRGEAIAPTSPGTATWDADGTLQLRWPPLDDARGAAVVLTDLDLAELARIPLTRPDRIRLRPEELPAPLRHRSRPVLWSVVIVRAGVEEVFVGPHLLER